MHPGLVAKVEDELDKLETPGFIQEVMYPICLDNIVLIKKKNGQIRVCIEFWYLNKACPKYDFPVSHKELP